MPGNEKETLRGLFSYFDVPVHPGRRGFRIEEVVEVSGVCFAAIRNAPPCGIEGVWGVSRFGLTPVREVQP